MGRGVALSDFEKGQILAFHSECLTEREIAANLNRSKTVVHNFLKAQEERKKQYKLGRKPKISQTATRALLRHASTGKYFARDLQTKLNLPVSVRRVQQLLHNAPFLQFKKKKREPCMTQQHKNARYEWARDHVTWDTRKWKRIIFSDEKKFNLDGPDGFAFYWHDLRGEEQSFSTRQQGGESVMLWGAMSYYGLSNLCVVRGNQDSAKYCKVLQRGLLPFAAETLGERWTFQQDNASTHRSNYTKNWFESKEVDVMYWPAKSPDLNIIENLWGILARSVYREGRQFDNVEDLKQAIKLSWNSIDETTIKTLYKSLTNRCVEVIEKKGNKTSY